MAFATAALLAVSTAANFLGQLALTKRLVSRTSVSATQIKINWWFEVIRAFRHHLNIVIYGEVLLCWLNGTGVRITLSRFWSPPPTA